MAIHSNILAWRMPQTEELGGPQSMGSQRVGHDWSDLARMQEGTKYLVGEVKVLLEIDVVVVLFCCCFVLRVKRWQRSYYVSSLNRILWHRRHLQKFNFSLWIRLKKQLRNWAPNSMDHGVHSRVAESECLKSESVFKNYLSLLLSLSSAACLPMLSCTLRYCVS